MKKTELFVFILSGLLLIGGLAGCVAKGGNNSNFKQVSRVNQDDFKAVLNDPGAMGMTAPPGLRFDGKFGTSQYPAWTSSSSIKSTMSRNGEVNTTTINGAVFDVFTKKVPEGKGMDCLILIVQAAEKMDLSKAENVSVFEQNLRKLFAIHKETSDVYVRMSGRILSLHGDSLSKEPKAEPPGGPPRFSVSDNGVILDNLLGMEWVVGPNKGTSYNQAVAWVGSCSVAGGGWRMPNMLELMSIYTDGSKPYRLNPLFEMTPKVVTVWAESKGASGAKAFSFLEGRKVEIKDGRDDTPSAADKYFRVFGVRGPRLLVE